MFFLVAIIRSLALVGLFAHNGEDCVCVRVCVFK